MLSCELRWRSLDFEDNLMKANEVTQKFKQMKYGGIGVLVVWRNLGLYSTQLNCQLPIPNSIINFCLHSHMPHITANLIVIHYTTFNNYLSPWLLFSLVLHCIKINISIVIEVHNHALLTLLLATFLLLRSFSRFDAIIKNLT